jgi:hypothetical protein
MNNDLAFEKNSKVLKKKWEINNTVLTQLK